jgi:hypothetical protein
MAEDIVKGLFGLSPYEIQQQRIADTNTQAHNYAVLDPFQKASASMFQAGAGLGGVGAQMAGLVNPAEEKAQQKQAILSRYDISTKDGQAQAIQAAKAMGRMDVVLELQQYDNAMQKEYYGLQKTKSEIEQNSARAAKARRNSELKNTYPKEYNMALAEAKRLHPNDPEAESAAISELMPKYLKNPNLQFKEYVNDKGEKTFGVVDLTLADVTQVGGSAPTLKKRTIGVEGKPKLAQDQEYDTATGKWVNVGGEYERHGAGVSVNLPRQEQMFEGTLGKGQAEELIKGRASADDAVQIIKTAQTGRAILDKGMVTGFGANFIVGAGQALKQAGIDFGGDAMAQNVGKIIKQFGSGTGLSDADREYATKMAAGLITLDEKSLRKILDINEAQARWIINQHNSRAQGIKSNIPLTVEMPPSSAKTVIREVKLKDGRIGVEYSDGTKGYK